MKHFLLFLSCIIFPVSLYSQKDTMSVVRTYPQKTFISETPGSNISIYPVPVRDNTFTIKADRDMVMVKVTNMIGQDIFRAQYKNPVSVTKVLLTRPARGMYLVTISFTDGTRIVKKVMIENPD